MNTRVHANDKKNMSVSGWVYVCLVHQQRLFSNVISAYVLNLTSVVPMGVFRCTNGCISWKYKNSQFDIVITTTMMMLIIMTKRCKQYHYKQLVLFARLKTQLSSFKTAWRKFGGFSCSFLTMPIKLTTQFGFIFYKWPREWCIKGTHAFW